MKYRRIVFTILSGLLIAGATGFVIVARTGNEKLTNSNPLIGKTLYVDKSRPADRLVAQYQANHDNTDAKLMDRVAKQPGTTWLVGPSASDPKADKDIAAVARTSTEAFQQGTVPVYELYAIPDRDACAGYSQNGFSGRVDYLAWVDRILAAVKQPAVFSVEADAVAQTIHDSCLSPSQITDRYGLLQATMKKLSASPKALGAYLDAGHSEWFPDPSALVRPLQQSGIDYGRGIAVNVSFFVPTDEADDWAQRLLSQLGGHKGAIIDTSRNGRGAPDTTVTGDARWCNPAGRGLGDVPTTDTKVPGIDAYLWIKNIGESDGSCNGYPAAGTFVPALALDLARNAKG